MYGTNKLVESNNLTILTHDEEGNPFMSCTKFGVWMDEEKEDLQNRLTIHFKESEYALIKSAAKRVTKKLTITLDFIHYRQQHLT